MTNSSRPAHIDHITGKSFATTYAVFLKPGQRYAATFDAAPREVVKVGALRESDMTVTVVRTDTPAGKCSRVRADRRYFER